MNALEQLKGAFVQALGVNPKGDFETLAYGKTQGWDSVAHMALVAEIESTFDIMLSTDDVIGMSTFQQAKEIVAKYGVAVTA
jgi:acyl carrier protein